MGRKARGIRLNKKAPYNEGALMHFTFKNQEAGGASMAGEGEGEGVWLS